MGLCALLLPSCTVLNLHCIGNFISDSVRFLFCDCKKKTLNTGVFNLNEFQYQPQDSTSKTPRAKYNVQCIHQAFHALLEHLLLYPVWRINGSQCLNIEGVHLQQGAFPALIRTQSD